MLFRHNSEIQTRQKNGNLPLNGSPEDMANTLDKDFSKILQKVKIAKSYHSGVASLYISMRNVIIITTSSKEIQEIRVLR